MSTENPSWLTAGAMVRFAYTIGGVYKREPDWPKHSKSKWRMFRLIDVGERALVLEYVVGLGGNQNDSVMLLMSCGSVVRLHNSLDTSWSLLKPA